MADMGSFGGMDEESAEIKRLDAEVVSSCFGIVSCLKPRNHSSVSHIADII